jgi:hypothetical protein
VTQIRSLLAGTTASTITDAQLATIVALEAAHTGTPQELWAKIAALPDFVNNQGRVADLQFAIQTFAFSDGNVPLAKLLRARRPAGAPDARSLLDVSATDWRAMVQTSLDQGGTLPLGIAGDTLAAKITNYANGLAMTVEGAFTTVVMGLRVASPAPIDTAAAAVVLTKNPKLDPDPVRASRSTSGAWSSTLATVAPASRGWSWRAGAARPTSPARSSTPPACRSWSSQGSRDVDVRADRPGDLEAARHPQSRILPNVARATGIPMILPSGSALAGSGIRYQVAWLDRPIEVADIFADHFPRIFLTTLEPRSSHYR